MARSAAIFFRTLSILWLSLCQGDPAVHGSDAHSSTLVPGSKLSTICIAWTSPSSVVMSSLIVSLCTAQSASFFAYSPSFECSEQQYSMIARLGVGLKARATAAYEISSRDFWTASLRCHLFI